MKIQKIRIILGFLFRKEIFYITFLLKIIFKTTTKLKLDITEFLLINTWKDMLHSSQKKLEFYKIYKNWDNNMSSL